MNISTDRLRYHSQTFTRPTLWLGVVVALSFPFSFAYGQRVRFAQSTPVPSAPWQNQSFPTGAPNFPSTTPVLPSTAPNGLPSVAGSNPSWGGPGLVPVNPSNAWGGPGLVPVNPSNAFATPQFDPYAPSYRSSAIQYPMGGGNPNPSNFNPWGFGQPSVLPQQPIFPNNYPSSVYPNATPPALFPGSSVNSNWGLGGNSWGNSVMPGTSPFGSNPGWNGLGNGWFNNPSGPIFNGQVGTAPGPLRFFMGPRFRHTWVQANREPTSLETNFSDLSLVFAIPNFIGSTQPLFIVPSFSIHTFDGPRLATADLPGQTYSGFLDVGWESDPIRTIGAELGVRAGVFSDFDTFTSDSFRVMGKGIGRLRLTPNATLRAGVYYIDRNKFKVVPAGGILWVPNPDTRFDIFFPEPKLAHYLSTIGTSDVWWYVTGYYGGGTWTVKRSSGAKESVDINEMIVALGLEFGRNDLIRLGRRLGFIEAGYAFNRELLFKARPMDNTDLEDGLVVRAGFGY